MPVELSSFDVIIGMDWLANHHAVIICDEKIVRIPYGNEVLTFQEDLPDYHRLDKLNSKSTRQVEFPNRLEDVPIIRDFSEVFPEDEPRID
ncbi:putative reverse transcriptase domain-containing protein [Tanacetum coccineum]|uniref:Reverse transcriptase domain-containing protein n=1 Tax=Tanacetum coccineum TaxID=301880 RepID=A0ABQ4YGG0_9ASTR